MQENDYKPVMTIAQVAETGGWIFCVAGIFIGLTLMGSGYLQGVMGFAMGLSNTLPTLVGGLLLIVAGRILRAVTANSNAEAELPQEKN